jgi:16S rRNA (guanine(1405)-N(7))-methyltransferase
LVNAVRAGAKYAQISEALIRDIGARELTARRTLKDAVKATRNKLHQVGGAYLGASIDYSGALEELRRAKDAHDAHALRQACRSAMRMHASTRERLGILDQFYSTILSGLPGVHVVLDIACGLNPLAIPWMPLNEIEYHAYDVYEDMVDFINGFLKLIDVNGGAEVCDVMQSPPARKADLALLLKTLPCLEQIDKSAGFRLLNAIHADHVVVSFPVHSLGGARKGMLANYERHFHQLARQADWAVRRFEFKSELAFLIRK